MPVTWLPAHHSESALSQKVSYKYTDDGQPVHSFKSPLGDLSTIVSNHLKPNDEDFPGFIVITTPTMLQKQALGLLGYFTTPRVHLVITLGFDYRKCAGRLVDTRFMNLNFGLILKPTRVEYFPQSKRGRMIEIDCSHL